ncbi:putative aspartyl protease [Mesonia hippocampi]|uniref:Putative aspartyl protease n=1 Tax=Mesonia hippocampi TaxID=1628250 RepID=A0A840ETJ4_9FLAO|nr:retropepsin-like aspartic protease [Mesonia hippocampi]MBB4118227.1 putative aspartyl protease [Mesonia hippocampi]
MASLRKFLKEKDYQRVKLIETATNHLELKVEINGIEGNFILDTGASSSCIANDMVEHFKLYAEESDIRAAGAGAINMETQLANKNTLKIGSWKRKKVSLVLFDLSHINQALTDHDANKVHGIIGADILDKGKAIIDYKSKSLFLK